MEFVPTAADYFILIVFTFLALLSGLFGFLFCCCGSSERGDGTEFLRPHRTAIGSPRKSPAASNPSRGFLTLFETILLILINTVVISSFVLLLTAQLGVFRFRYWCLFFVLFLAPILLYLYLRRRTGRPLTATVSFDFAPSDWFFLPLAALAFFVFNPPSHAIHTRDPGGYANIAVKISETGSLRFKDPAYERFNSKDQEMLFLPFPLRDVAYPQVIPGFHLIDPASGELTPRYFHLFPIWLALAFKLWRFQGMFELNIFFGVLSVLILVPLGQSLFGSKLIGFLAAFLLALNLGQIWIVRSPFSEILTQFFLLAGIWTLSIGMRDGQKGFCQLAGLLFGLSLFTRVDSVLAVVALLVFLYINFLTRDRSQPRSSHLVSFFLPLAAMIIYALLHTLVFAYPYVETVLNTFRLASFSGYHLLVLAIVGIMIVLISSRRAPWPQLVSTNGSPKKRVMVLSFVFLTGLLIYAYFVRPRTISADLIPLPYPLEGNVPYCDEISLVRLGWYLSPLGILLAYLGSLITLGRLMRGKSVESFPFVLILGAFAFFYLYKSRAFPDNYWVIRRYVEIVMPGFLLLASLALSSLLKVGRIRPSRIWKAAVACCVGVVFASLFWPLMISYGLLGQREWEHTFPQLENLAGSNQNADILLLERGQFQDFFSSPLKFIFHKMVYPFANDQPDAVAFDRLMEKWTREGKRVNLLASEERTVLRSHNYEFVPKELFRFRTRVVESTYERLPHAIEDLSFTVQLYEVGERREPVDSTSIGLNLGFHFGFRATGFYNMELSDDYEPFRWCAGQSSIDLPSLEGRDDAVLSLRVRREVPENLAATPIQVFFNDQMVGEPKLSPKFEVISFPISNAQLRGRGGNQIRFSANTYNPARLALGDDVRELGFMIHSLKLQLRTPISAAHPYALDFGAQSDEVDGRLADFHPKEPGSFRWSGPAAQVVVDRPLAPGQDLKISVRALKSSPNPVFRQFLKVAVNRKDVGQTELLDRWDQFRTYDFPIPPGVPRSPQTVIVMTVSPPWTPTRSDTYTDDWRKLGCAVDWLKITAMK
jgi:hypothetical protein